MTIHDGASLDRLLHGEATDPRTYLMAFGYRPPHLDAVADDAEPLVAEINHGIWIARCPCNRVREGVHGGGVVWLARPVVWCPLCRNRTAGRRWRHVALPAERVAIEATLSERPQIEHRNWWPGETVDDLLADNAAHGIGGS